MMRRIWGINLLFWQEISFTQLAWT